MIASKITEECEALNLAALPHLGYYGPEQYDLIFPCMIIQNKNFWKDESEKYLPLQMRNEIKNTKQGDTELQNGNVYSITYDARMYFNSEALRHRMNLVLHPLVFKDLKHFQDDKRSFRASIHPSDVFDCSVAECTDERDGVKFQSQDFEIYLHDQIFMSPNNCAFTFSYLRPVVSFGCIVRRTEYSDTMIPQKVLDVYWMTVITHNSVGLYDPLLQQWDTNTNGLRSKEEDPQKHYSEILKNSLSAVDAICEDLSDMFVSVFQSEIALAGLEIEQEDLRYDLFEKFLQQALIEEKGKTDTILSEFHNYIWLKFGKPSQSDFGKNFFEGIDNALKLRLFASYIIQIMTSYYDALYHNAAVMLSPSNTILLDEISRKKDRYLVSVKDVGGITTDKFHELIKQLRKAKSKDMLMIEDIIKLFCTGEESEGYAKFSASKEMWQSYIYERTWVFFARINDIHGDFGRVSFWCSPELDATYHLNNEFKVKLFMDLQNTLTDL